MAVIVKYVVVRDGKQDMIFATRKEADAYDKMLDIAERLYAYLQGAELDLSEDQLDALAFFMAQHRDPISRLLKGGKLETDAAAVTAASVPKDRTETSSSPKSKGSAASKRPRAPKPKAVA